MKEINRTRRAYMISAKIPFVILDKQIYLPFMGIVLQDKFQMKNHFTERLQPSTQVLFFKIKKIAHINGSFFCVTLFDN
ncbi:MAG: hypothetical protein ACK5LL_09875 [Suipraeoptans sp.]